MKENIKINRNYSCFRRKGGSEQVYAEILSDYMNKYLPVFYQQEYNFKPAKSSDFSHVGLKKFTDQSLLTHIINGLYGVTSIIKVLSREAALNLNEEKYKKLLVAYTLHDLHKLDNTESEFQEEFNISLKRYEEELEKLNLQEFVDINPKLCRAVSIHINARNKKGTADFSQVDNLLVNLGRLADGLSSSNTLKKAKQNSKLLKKSINSLDLARRAEFEFHRLEEYRGISTNIIHEVTADIISDEINLFPVLYFPNGTVYLKLEKIKDIEKEDIVEKITEDFFGRVERLGKSRNGVQGAYKVSYNKFEDYALLFGGPEKLMKEAQEKYISNLQSTGFAKELVDKRIGKYCDSQEDFEKKFNVDLSWDEEEDKAQRWGLVQKALAVTKTIARFYLPKNEVDEWLFEKLNMDKSIYEKVKKEMGSRYVSGPRMKDDCLVYAFHFLKNKNAPDGRSLFEVPIEEKLEVWLIDTLIEILSELDSREARLNYVNEKIGMKSDFKNYILNQLELSFIQKSGKPADVFEEYSRKKSGSHKRLCVLCNRFITKKVSKGKAEIKAGILEDSIQTFSNRIIPKLSNVSAHVWCPICYLEFMLRQILNLGFAPNADKNSSRRIYLFLFPDYYFTSDLLADSEKLLSPFRDRTDLKLRTYGGEETTFSEIWLKRAQNSGNWLDNVSSLFQKEAERIAKRHKDSEQKKLGEYVSAPPIHQKNFHLLTMDNSVSENVDITRKPTETEMLAKSFFLGAILQNLLGVRVYISKTPYLNSLSHHEFKTSIKLDEINSSFRKILPLVSLGKAGELLGEIPLSKIKDLLNLLSAVWEINKHLNERDKQIANVLAELNSNDLAGAHFYKRFEQEKGCNAPVLLVNSVEILLSYLGGERMSLAKEIAEKSFNLYRPSSRKGGRAHRYENLFRTAVEGIKEANTDDEEEIISRLAGRIDKRLQRLSQDKGYVCNYSQDEVEDFVRYIVERLFIERCNRSYADLEREVNSLADGVYFEIGKLTKKFWEEKEAKK